MVADSNINEATWKHAVPLSKVSNGYILVPAARAVRVQILETCITVNRLQVLHTLCRLLWPGRSYHG